ncbi:hypothetical protein MUK42_18431 [Musa troglodytarum]|uniref:Uncharacterized protein n=1 Tax=Musa troglodytarum TaxID=320322 RepID=A0A9E7GQZ6_9LILI|nr:hypothetical protein MUK42_18431 [Musa troglodytarum]
MSSSAVWPSPILLPSQSRATSRSTSRSNRSQTKSAATVSASSVSVMHIMDEQPQETLPSVTPNSSCPVTFLTINVGICNLARHTLHRKSREASNPGLEPTGDKQHRGAYWLIPSHPCDEDDTRLLASGGVSPLPVAVDHIVMCPETE